MLIQQDNNSSIASYRTPLQMLTNADKVVDASQPVLALQVGSLLDPGIKRKHRPNEDSIFVTQGFMTSPSTPPKPFALLMVADGMGGQARGQEARQRAVQSLIGYVSGSLRSKHTTSEAFLPLLVAAVQYANRVVAQRDRQQRA